MAPDFLDARVTSLERELRRARRLLAAVAGMAVLVPLLAFRPTAPEVLRVRGLVIVDDQGRDRIVLGAPIPDPREGRRIAPATGMQIVDTAGVERFGLSLFPAGDVVMGFDAPPRTGDDRNRERITLVADAKGGSAIRLLDRHTRAKAFLQLDDDDNAYLDLLDWRDKEIRVRRIGSGKDTIQLHPR